ncbi:MAG TPA: DUF1643 domain-containing protein [Marmoricola sp.]
MAEALFDLEPMARDAVLSLDGVYRYSLHREWCTGFFRPRWVTFVMLNPSTADAVQDDPTIRRCVTFAKALGGTGLAVVNLYAIRATSPTEALAAADPVGPRNDHYLAMFLEMAARYDFPLIAAWGTHAKPERVAEVLALPGADRFTALGLTKSGAPRHPLYLRRDARPTAWPARIGGPR